MPKRRAADVAALPAARSPSPIDTALDHAIITAPDARDRDMLVRLDAILARHLSA